MKMWEFAVSLLVITIVNLGIIKIYGEITVGHFTGEIIGAMFLLLISVIIYPSKEQRRNKIERGNNENS